MHVLSKQAEGSLNKIYESAYQKPSLTGSTAVRAHGLYHRFQNPSEIKRIRKHGYKARLRTKAGREIIMRRILKGRHCLTH
ncbi:39S ribosomal protein L34, mitochondrial [Armadillidium nasatum]|uniref:Large ribosomal subunit protein bL34m n=1 Tax=Armadillidium nasatum TaxID=96803 RepID=A0A5N5TH09_9CRUS|nr:39S ribosomal protein L34, mitochondrial [Armadillidium nasatum]